MVRKWTVRIVVSLLLIAALLYSFNPASVLSIILSARPEYLLLAASVYSITLLMLSMRWRMILHDMGEELSLLSAYQAFAGGMILSDLTPGRVGELSRPFLVRDRVDLGRGMASVALDRYSDILTIFILGTTGMLFFAEDTPYLLPASLTVLTIVMASVALWLSRKAVLERLDRLGSSHLSRIAHSLDVAICEVDSIEVLLLRSVLLTALAWIAHALRVYLIASSVGYFPPVQMLFMLQPLVSALSLIPVTVSGLGLVEGGLVALLAGLGVPAAAGISIALLDRVITAAFHLFAGWHAASRSL
ncbi:MAG: lysylphosphatidylglycerol synthase transmembrane domain-containing protein [Methanothrix sp.]|nr:lysylphosphatidylglycerol synthase transmembrane domain-containing protein [Methanothrix sp.]